jgi:hypothetical protein
MFEEGGGGGELKYNTNYYLSVCGVNIGCTPVGVMGRWVMATWVVVAMQCQVVGEDWKPAIHQCS